MKEKKVILICFIIMLVVSGMAVGRIIMEKNDKSLIKKYPSKFREKAVFCTRENDLDFTKESTDAEILLGLISLKDYKASEIEIIDKKNNVSCKAVRIDERDVNEVFPLKYCAMYNNLDIESVIKIDENAELEEKNDNKNYSYIKDEYDLLSSSSFPFYRYTLFAVSFEVPDKKCTINNLTVKLGGKEYDVNVGSIRFNQVNIDSEKYEKKLYPKIKSYNFTSDMIIFDDDNTYKTNTFCIKT
ncbi:MAG: hypothetical protein K6G26_09395, partial [Lachnospiraceae bacterium]|nr:hypothetical protein [Lachnospiraceae bacterium]